MLGYGHWLRIAKSMKILSFYLTSCRTYADLLVPNLSALWLAHHFQFAYSKWSLSCFCWQLYALFFYCRDCQIFASILILIAISAERLLRHVLVWGPSTLVCHMNLIFRAQIWSLFVSQILNLQFRETLACRLLGVQSSALAGSYQLIYLTLQERRPCGNIMCMDWLLPSDLLTIYWY